MKQYNSKSRKQHPFDLVFAEGNPKYLVIGSFPTTENKMSFTFFYPNSNNKFWKVLSQVFPNSKTKLNLEVSIKDKTETKEQNAVDRKNFCKENEIAMTDMIESCIRLNDNSKDEQLLVHRYNSIIDILKKYESIERIVITAKSLGASANHHFYQYLTMNEVGYTIDVSNEICKGCIEVGGREITIYSVDSTSSLNSHVDENDLIQLYKKAFSQNGE